VIVEWEIFGTDQYWTGFPIDREHIEDGPLVFVGEEDRDTPGSRWQWWLSVESDRDRDRVAMGWAATRIEAMEAGAAALLIAEAEDQ
jgi:hypothetical protein